MKESYINFSRLLDNIHTIAAIWGSYNYLNKLGPPPPFISRGTSCRINKCCVLNSVVSICGKVPIQAAPNGLSYDVLDARVSLLGYTDPVG